TAGGNPAVHIAKWNGSSWSALGSGINNIGVNALGLDVHSNLFAGGLFNFAGGLGVQNVAKWNGSIWSTIGSGLSGALFAVTLDPSGNLYAGGLFTSVNGVAATNIIEWNGTNWLPLGAGVVGGLGTQIYALTTDNAGNLYASGIFTNIGGIAASNIA